MRKRAWGRTLKQQLHWVADKTENSENHLTANAARWGLGRNPWISSHAITARYHYEASYRDITRQYLEYEDTGEVELPLGAYPPLKLLRFCHPADPERSPLPNLTVR